MSLPYSRLTQWGKGYDLTPVIMHLRRESEHCYSEGLHYSSPCTCPPLAAVRTTLAILARFDSKLILAVTSASRSIFALTSLCFLPERYLGILLTCGLGSIWYSRTGRRTGTHTDVTDAASPSCSRCAQVAISLAVCFRLLNRWVSASRSTRDIGSNNATVDDVPCKMLSSPQKLI